MLDEQFHLKLADFGFAIVSCGRDGSGKLKTTLGTEGYMAPELLNKNNTYHGIPNDIFGAGVILFIFMTGLPPFKKASPRDPHFGQFCINRHSKFWDSHKHRLKTNFSDDFMTLINAMLSYDPTHRPSIAEIYAHPWLKNNKIATHEEVVLEFTERKKYVDAAVIRQKAEEEKIKEMEKQQKQKVNNMAFGRIQAHRGNDETAPTFDTTWTDITNKFADGSLKTDHIQFPKIEKSHVKTGSLFTSSLKNEEFVQAIVYICDQLGASVSLDKNTKIKVSKNMSDQQVELKIKLYQDENGAKHAEFFKQEGPIMSYYELTGDITDEFAK